VRGRGGRGCSSTEEECDFLTWVSTIRDLEYAGRGVRVCHPRRKDDFDGYYGGKERGDITFLH